MSTRFAILCTYFLSTSLVLSVCGQESLAQQLNEFLADREADAFHALKAVAHAGSNGIQIAEEMLGGLPTLGAPAHGKGVADIVTHDSSSLLTAAIEDLEKIQDYLQQNPGLLRAFSFPSHATRGFQLLQAFVPAGEFNMTECEQIIGTTEAPASDESTDTSCSNDDDDDEEEEREKPTTTPAPVASGALESPLTLPAVASSANPTEPSNNLLTPLSGIVTAATSRLNPCKALATGRQTPSGLTRGFLFNPSGLTGVLANGLEMPAERVQNMIQDRINTFQQFMAGTAEAIRSRVGTDAAQLQKNLMDQQTQIQTALEAGSDTLSTFLNGAADTFKATVNQYAAGFNNVVDAQPALYAWVRNPLEGPDTLTPLLRGMTKPLQSIGTDASNAVQMALAPFGLGQEIQQLCEIQPTLTGLFEHFNNPAAAPVFLTLRTLLDEIKNTGTLRGMDRFQSLFDPFKTLGQPLSLQLGVANACLDYLNSVTPLISSGGAGSA